MGQDWPTLWPHRHHTTWPSKSPLASFPHSLQRHTNRHRQQTICILAGSSILRLLGVRQITVTITTITTNNRSLSRRSPSITPPRHLIGRLHKGAKAKLKCMGRKLQGRVQVMVGCSVIRKGNIESTIMSDCEFQAANNTITSIRSLEALPEGRDKVVRPMSS